MFVNQYEQIIHNLINSMIDQKQTKEIECVTCQKRYSSTSALNTHIKLKHPENIPIHSNEHRNQRGRPKGSVKSTHKTKSAEQFRYELQDKILAFLGELGEKAYQNQNQQGQEDQSLKPQGEVNYLENNVVRTPYEPEFDVLAEIPFNSAQKILQSKPLFESLINDIQQLYLKIISEKEKWDFKDPLQFSQNGEQQFTLMEVENIIKNGRKKGLKMAFPQFSVFLLWIAKICKPTPWKQFFLILTSVNKTYQIFLQNHQKNSINWKNFANQVQSDFKLKVPEDLKNHIEIVEPQDLINFLSLYVKWVECFVF